MTAFLSWTRSALNILQRSDDEVKLNTKRMKNSPLYCHEVPLNTLKTEVQQFLQAQCCRHATPSVAFQSLLTSNFIWQEILQKSGKQWNVVEIMEQRKFGAHQSWNKEVALKKSFIGVTKPESGRNWRSKSSLVFCGTVEMETKV